MKRVTPFLTLAFASLVLAGCAGGGSSGGYGTSGGGYSTNGGSYGTSDGGYSTSGGGYNQTSAAPASSDAPSMAEQACLREVTMMTNNRDVVMLSSSYSEAGTEVIVGVGEQRARWRCIGYRDGTTGGVMSMTDEGGL